MKPHRALAIALAVGGAAAAAQASLPASNVLAFAIVRDGMPIGNSSFDIKREGPQTTVTSRTHIEVKLAFMTLYRYDQAEVEQWANGRFIALNATTDDNGSVRKISATRSGDQIALVQNGQERMLPGSVVPLSVWNHNALLQQKAVLNPRDGSVGELQVVDRGSDEVVVHGQKTRAHHYAITTSFTQDIWYDDAHRLVQLEFKGSDGSTIRYEPAA